MLNFILMIIGYTPVIIALFVVLAVQALKYTGRISSKDFSFLALVLGVAIGGIVALVTNDPILQMMAIGALSSALASGLYEMTMAENGALKRVVEFVVNSVQKGGRK